MYTYSQVQLQCSDLPVTQKLYFFYINVEKK
jgi:hypothetical protein